MKPAKAKKALLSSIQEITDYKWLYSARPGRDNTRARKLPFESVISAILGFGSGTLHHELLDFCQFDPNLPTSTAFIRRRATILPEAFETLFRSFTGKLCENAKHGEMPFLAADGSDLRICANPNDPDSYFPGTNGQKHYNLLHLNALYDLNSHLYMDAVVQKRMKADESAALTAMVDRSDIPKALLIADRGYESYNNLAHIQEKGWYFLIRLRRGAHGMTSGFDLPDEEEFDIPFCLNLTRKQSKEAKMLCRDRNHYKCLPASSRFDFLPKKTSMHDPATFYTLRFRIVRFRISESTCETIITNLDANKFPVSEIKKIYAMRWGIETSFRKLKFILGLLYLHAKKAEFILQEIFAKLTMYNFCEAITQSVVVQQSKRKYAYQVSFSDAAHICMQFFRRKLAPAKVEALLMRFISPIRPGRKNARRLVPKHSVSFVYRVA